VSAFLFGACTHPLRVVQTRERATELTSATTPTPEPSLALSDVRLAAQPSDAPETRCPSPHCSPAGTTSEVTLDTHTEAVYVLFTQYVRCLNNHAMTDLRELLGEHLFVTNATSAHPWSREHAITLHERLLERLDARGFEAFGVQIFSFDDCQQQHCEASLRPGEWLVQWRSPSFRAVTLPNAPNAPTQFVVRWIHGGPHIVAFNSDFLTPRIQSFP
jgi:hypothetical protein